MLIWEGEGFSLRRIKDEPTLPLAVIFRDSGPGQPYGQAEGWDLEDAQFVILATAEEKETLDRVLSREESKRPEVPASAKEVKDVYDYFYSDVAGSGIYASDAHVKAIELVKLWLERKNEQEDRHELGASSDKGRQEDASASGAATPTPGSTGSAEGTGQRATTGSL